MPRDLISEPIVDSPVVTLLKQAKARIERGWIQRQAIMRSGTPKFSYCMIGAITRDDHGAKIAFTSNKTQNLTYLMAEHMLGCAVEKLCQYKQGIIPFNDHWRRTHADVVLAYDLAITLQERTEHGLPI